MYVLAQIWLEGEEKEYDGFNPMGVYLTANAAIQELGRCIREARKAGYYVKEEYYPAPFSRGEYHSEVWLGNGDTTMIMVIRKVHKYDLG